jgi:two-component system cell cycle response regulator
LNLHAADPMIPHEDRRRLDSTDSSEMRVLIADDDPNFCAYITTLARRLGFVVDAAADGERAVEYLGAVRYDVAIIDLQMPRVDGLGVIAHLRNDEATRGVYAMMLTGVEDTQTKLTALDAGFDDFVAKSSPEPELLAKLGAARRVAARQRSLDSTIRELYGMATRDELTQLFNRRFFIAEMRRMLAQGTRVSLVLFDLDDFKGINDTYGHLAGDRVLRDIGALFHRTTRRDDLVARLGGDEFVLVLANTSVEESGLVGVRLANAVRNLRWTAGLESIEVNVTTGTSSAEAPRETSLEQLLEAADRDLYRNKCRRRRPPRNEELALQRPPGRGADIVLTLTPQAERSEKGDSLALPPEPAPPRPEVQ